MSGRRGDEELVAEEGRGLGDETLVILPRHAYVPVVVPRDEALVAHSSDRRAAVGDVAQVEEGAHSVDLGEAALGDALNGCEGCGVCCAH